MTTMHPTGKQGRTAPSASSCLTQRPHPAVPRRPRSWRYSLDMDTHLSLETPPLFRRIRRWTRLYGRGRRADGAGGGRACHSPRAPSVGATAAAVRHRRGAGGGTAYFLDDLSGVMCLGSRPESVLIWAGDTGSTGICHSPARSSRPIRATPPPSWRCARMRPFGPPRPALKCCAVMSWPLMTPHRIGVTASCRGSGRRSSWSD